MSAAPGPAAEAVRLLLEEDAADAYEHAPAGYVSTIADGTIVRANATFHAWTGYTADDLLGRRRFQDLFTTAGRIYFETHLRPLLAMQGSLNEVALDLPRKDGTILPVLVNALEKRAATGGGVLHRYTVFNATDRRRYELQLLESRRHAESIAKAKTELLAMLSHDIRTPLGSIVAAAHILRASGLPAGQLGTVRILESAAASMLGLVNRVLEDSRLEATGVTLDERAFDLRALLAQLVADLQPLAAQKGIEMDCRVDARLPGELVGDATKLGQVVGNLVGNALKFTERGRVGVTLDVLSTDASAVVLRVCVEDTGIGIAPEAMNRIFEEYQQESPAIGRRFGGTGLGLAIVRRILAACGSALEVASRPGEGSRFCFELRLRTP